MADVEIFDAALFGISAPEAELMDSQQRLLMEASWELLRDNFTATTCPDGTPVSERMGVYVGMQQMEYGGLAAAHAPAMGAFTATGSPFSVAAGRISFTHGLRGPAVSIDTACSSALVGTHMGLAHLQKGASAALAAGINLMLAEHTTAATQIAGMLTLDGHCKTLDASADGYVRAEACIVLRLESGLITGAHGDAVVLRSTFVNQDGRYGSLSPGGVFDILISCVKWFPLLSEYLIFG